MISSETSVCVLLGILTGFALAVMFSFVTGSRGVVKTAKNISHVAYSGECKMVLVVRKDLKMGVGKIAAQCAHAAVAVVEELMMHNPKYTKKGNPQWWSWYSAWSTMGCTKIALQCPDEAAMMDIASKAKKSGIPYYVIRDAGRTQIASGSKTVVAVGPAPVDKVNELTGHLKLL